MPVLYRGRTVPKASYINLQTAIVTSQHCWILLNGIFQSVYLLCIGRSMNRGSISEDFKFFISPKYPDSSWSPAAFHYLVINSKLQPTRSNVS